MSLEKYNTFFLINGKDFEETTREAYENKQNSFCYHCQDYFYKQDPQTKSIYIYSRINGEMIRVGTVKIDGDKCIPTIDEGYEDYVSNTKTNYTIGKYKKKNISQEIIDNSKPM